MLPIPLWTKPEFGNLLSNPPKGQWHVQICAVEFYFSTFWGGCCMAVTHLFHKSQLDQTERVETHRDLDHHMLVCFHPIPKNGNQSGIIITRITRMVRNNTCWKHQQDQWTSQVVENLCFFYPTCVTFKSASVIGYWWLLAPDTLSLPTKTPNPAVMVLNPPAALKNWISMIQPG